MIKLTQNFSKAEFACRSGTPVPENLLSYTLELAQNLEVLRAHFGGKPIRILSGYRTPDYNQQIGGAKRSQHMRGTAADIRIQGIPPLVVCDAIEELIGLGLMKQGGLGRYNSFTHYDIRGTRARWKGKSVK